MSPNETPDPQSSNDPAQQQPDASQQPQSDAPQQPDPPQSQQPGPQDQQYAPQPPQQYAPQPPQFSPQQPQQQPGQPQQPQQQPGQYGQQAQPGAHQQQPYSQQPQYSGQQPGQQPQYSGQQPGQQPQYAQHAPGQPQHPQYGAPGAAQYGQPGGYPGQGGGQPPRQGLSKGALFGIIGGGVALLLVIILAVVFIFVPGGGSNSASGDKGDQPVKAKIAKTPSAAVKGYLNALAKGDAKTAVAYLDSSTDEAYLTDEVLQDSISRAPITEVAVADVPEPEGDANTYQEIKVDASYKVGDESVSQTYSVMKQYKGGYTVFSGTQRLSLSAFNDIDLSINGVPFEGGTASDSIELFPGSYAFAFDNQYFKLSTKSNEVLLASERDTQNFYKVQPALTKDATKKFRSLVAKSLKNCIASKKLKTKCGMDLTHAKGTDGSKPVQNTVNRKLTAEGKRALRTLKPRADYNVPTVYTASDYIKVDATLTAVLNGQRGRVKSYYNDVNKPSIDFAEENLKVTWSE